MLHEIPEQSRILGALTKWSRQATTPAEIPALVHEAIRQLRHARRNCRECACELIEIDVDSKLSLFLADRIDLLGEPNLGEGIATGY